MKLRNFFVSLCLAGTAAFVSLETAPAVDQSEQQSTALQHVYKEYIAIQSELSRDSVKGLPEHASAISQSAKTAGLPAAVSEQAEQLTKAADLKTARKAFKPLSESFIKYAAAHKDMLKDYHEAYCPMVKASWLQTGKTIRNPYMGKTMLDCGEFKS